MCLAITCCLGYRMLQNKMLLWTCDLLVSQKTMQRHFFSTLHPLSMVIFATATVLAFVLLRDSRFDFHCYTQREATPTQKLVQKCAATFRDFLRERLQSAFTLANQLCWIAQQTYMYASFWNSYIHSTIQSVQSVTVSCGAVACKHQTKKPGAINIMTQV